MRGTVVLRPETTADSTFHVCLIFPVLGDLV